MKVAHFITPAGFYGAEQWVLTFLKHFDAGDSVLICTNQDDKTLLNKAEEIGIKTFVLEVKGNFSLFDLISKLSDYLVKNNIDILHTHGYKSDIVGYFSSRKASIKVISTPHGWDLQSGIKVKIYDILDRFVLRFFDKVVPLSNALKMSLKHISPDKVILINNLVDLNGLPDLKSGDMEQVCYIGRLTELKCVNDIIKAISLLPENITLQVIGDGPKKNDLIALAADLNLKNRVSFLGFREDRLELLNNCGLLVLASLSEGTSRTLMEAMAMQKLVIGSNIPGNRNLIQDAKTGYLFSLHDYSHLASIIQNAINSKLESAEIAKNGKQYIYKSFSASSVVALYTSLYAEVLSSRS